MSIDHQVHEALETLQSLVQSCGVDSGHDQAALAIVSSGIRRRDQIIDLLADAWVDLFDGGWVDAAWLEAYLNDPENGDSVNKEQLIEAAIRGLEGVSK